LRPIQVLVSARLREKKSAAGDAVKDLKAIRAEQPNQLGDYSRGYGIPVPMGSDAARACTGANALR
jgi:hypothetical protein